MLHLLFNTPSAFRVSSWLSQLGETAFGPSKMTPKNKRLRPFLSRQGLPLAGRQLSVIFSYYVHSKKGSGRSLVKSKEVLTCSVWAVVRVIRPCFLRGAQNILYVFVAAEIPKASTRPILVSTLELPRLLQYLRGMMRYAWLIISEQSLASCGSHGPLCPKLIQCMGEHQKNWWMDVNGCSSP